LWHKHFEGVEIVGALSGHSFAFGGAERKKAAGRVHRLSLRRPQ
jgi:hypothetical protein